VASAEPPQQCIVDSRHLRRTLRELLDNDLTSAPDEATVRGRRNQFLHVDHQGDRSTSTASNRTTVNDPPRHSNKALTQRQAPAGHDTGLAVASAVAVRHGVRLVLSERLDRGVEVCRSSGSNLVRRLR